MRRLIIITAIAVTSVTAVSARAQDLASWYHPRVHGLVCASWFHPIGTRLRVTELHNGSSVIVTVIERGPAHRLVRQHRVVDLSREAFLKLDGTELGLAEVKVETIVVAPIPWVTNMQISVYLK
jgi:rare lipoprotein A